jgi:hypothetical protein
MELEFGGVVALVAVEDQQPVLALCPGCCVVIEMLNPIQTYGIGSPAIVGRCDTPVRPGDCTRYTGWQGGTARPR